MDSFIDITHTQKDEYNSVINHPLQSYEWGEFRKKTGVSVIRRVLISEEKIIDGFTLTLHKIPGTPYVAGYLPKGNPPTKELLQELKKIGKEKKCIYIQLEPNLLKNQTKEMVEPHLQDSEFIIYPSFHPLFTKYTFVLDLTKSEEELLKSMYPKTRYNIKVAQKNNVWVEENNSEAAFKEYLKLMNETTSRQKFYAHTPTYHRLQWETLPKSIDHNKLSYHLFHAKYKDSSGKAHTLTTWVLFMFHNTLYYPYGASSSLFRNTMHSNLMAWEAIKFGKKMGCTSFDMWGALGQEPDMNDPWYGFHRFKQGYAPKHVEFMGSYDLVISPRLYKLAKIADKARWAYLKLKKR